MPEKNKDYSKLTQRVAFLGILGATALVISFLENLIPNLPGMPPGAKPGFSNIVTMFTVSAMGLPSAIYIVLLKAVFAGVTRGATAFFMSLSGGFLSMIVMYVLLKRKRQPFSLIGVGIICAIVHNMAQLAVASVISATKSIFYYAPFLLLFAVITGSVTGTILKAIMPALEKVSKHFIK
ncbi:MAG: Gx transporter family protein [Clostridiales bacterium]|nr:Gx transporter family protein [Clostridiales bacterium]